MNEPDRMTNKKANFLIFLCWAAYTAAYIGRLNYNASMVEILAQLGTSKESAGAVSSAFFLAYGAGQLIHGLLSRRYNTKYSVTVALVVSSVLNLAMTFCGDMAVMKVIWFANGIFQSILWSSLIKTLSLYLPNERLPKAVMVMSTTVAIGTFGAYGLAALFSALTVRWTAIFYVSSAVLALVSILWFFGMRSVEKCEKATLTDGSKTSGKLRLTPVFAVSIGIILLTAIANGFIKDGVTTWVPSILKEEFGVSPSLSIIVTLLLPLLSIFGATLVRLLHAKQKNVAILNGLFYLLSTVFIGAILLTIGLRFAPLTLLLFALTACMMASVNNVITSIIPLYSRDKIDSGLSAGLLNTFCYVGSTLSIQLLGRIADTKGWNDVLECIFFFSLAAFLLCAVSTLLSRKKTP